MTLEEIKRMYIHRDRAVRVLSKDGQFRAVAIRNTDVVKTAKDKHQLSTLPTLLLGRALTAASMASMFLKGDERIIIETESAGIIRKVFAEAIQVGEVRGFVDFNLEKLNGTGKKVEKIEDALGIGLLKFTRVLYNQSEPITGIVPLIKGDISSDLTYYYLQSEQIPTALVLDIEFDNFGEVKTSCGIMVQAMPGHNKKPLEELIETLGNINNLSSYFIDEPNPVKVLNKILPFDFELLKSTQIDFFCRCTKDNFLNKLTTLTANEIIDMKNQNHNEIVCHYCNTRYKIEDSDFDSISENITAKMN
jgi:molecular chaperone Hsp33